MSATTAAKLDLPRTSLPDTPIEREAGEGICGLVIGFPHPHHYASDYIQSSQKQENIWTTIYFFEEKRT
jgi:hypothetical protein